MNTETPVAERRFTCIARVSISYSCTRLIIRSPKTGDEIDVRIDHIYELSGMGNRVVDGRASFTVAELTKLLDYYKIERQNAAGFRSRAAWRR